MIFLTHTLAIQSDRLICCLIRTSKVNTVTAEVMSEWSVSEQQSDNAGFTGFTLQWVNVEENFKKKLKFKVICHRHFTST